MEIERKGRVNERGLYFFHKELDDRLAVIQQVNRSQSLPFPVKPNQALIGMFIGTMNIGDFSRGDRKFPNRQEMTAEIVDWHNPRMIRPAQEEAAAELHAGAGMKTFPPTLRFAKKQIFKMNGENAALFASERL